MQHLHRHISEITVTEIFALVTNRTQENASLDLKRILFHPGAEKVLEEEKNDLARDFVAFANAHGGHIVVGIDEDENHCARELAPMGGDQAEKIAKAARDVAIQRIKPPLGLEIQPFRISDSEWLVIASIWESALKPHMWMHQDQMRFVVRDNDRKRTMQFEELKEMFLRGPQEEQMARVLGEIESLRSLVEDICATLQKRGEP